MSEDVRTAALAAFHEGDRRKVTELVIGMQEKARGDALLLQLLALSRSNKVDERVLLEAAAYDSHHPDPEAFFNLGVVEQGSGNVACAIRCYQQALRLQPDHNGALNNLSDLLRRQGRCEEAWQLISRYIEAGGETAGLSVRIAKIADDCNLPADAGRWFARAANETQADPAIVWEWAMQLLRDEQFAEGWQGFEARRLIFPHSALAIVNYSAPEWSGSSLEGRALLVHKEQGLGDSIMFASCLPDIADKAGRLHIAVQPQLVRLMAANFPQAEVWPSVSMEGREHESDQGWLDLAGPIDVHLPFGSLPLYLRAQGFPQAQAYLRASEPEVQMWQARLASLAPDAQSQLRVGIVVTARRDGQSGAGLAEGLPKSLPPQLARGLGQPGLAWFGLHDRSTADQLALVPALDIVDTSPWLYDLADTAALIANLDVVVAVDTAVAHLAAAMGKKVLLMLRRHADWRWGRSRTDSYWYEDVEVFRQQHEGDWAPVVAEVAARLGELSQRGCSDEAKADSRKKPVEKDAMA